MEFITESEIINVIQKVVNDVLIRRFTELGMNATGQWLESLEVVAKDSKGIIRGQDYTEYLAKGRAGGSLPPIAPLTKWVTAKFGVGGKQAVSIAWAVAKKIQREGTTHYQKGGTDLLEILSEPNTLEIINTEVQQKITVSITKELQRQINEIL
jgi:hypothetical protein